MTARLLVVAALLAATAHAAGEVPPLPSRLATTGLFDDGTTRVRATHLAFAPQYPLWSDGAAKRRWIHLPSGGAIDGTDPDAWDFPRGTRVWKEFGHGRPIETRYIERLPDGAWRYATYVWSEDGREAVLAPERGIALARPDVPGGRYVVPSRQDCLACHEGPRVPLLGFSALQLSSDRDPQAPHAEPRDRAHIDLAGLVATGRIVNLPASLVVTPPRIEGRSPTERAALGYLHANCGHCHDDAGALTGLDLALRQRAGDAGSVARTLASLVGHGSRFRAPGDAAPQRVAAGAPTESVIARRMRSANPYARMPPLGVSIVDDAGLALVERWIRHDVQPTQGETP